MKYKVGDRVKYGSEICTVTKVLESQGKFKYRVQSDTWFDVVEDKMIEGLVGEETKVDTALNPIEPKSNANCLTQERVDEMSLDKARQITDFEYEGLAYTLPEGYQFVDGNGNVINATKIVLEKKKKEYPKTFLECCDVLNIGNLIERGVKGYKAELFDTLQKLYICRDAYWKIYGEEMGLGKPWEPDFTNDDEERYGIYTAANKVVKDFCGVGDVNTILTFPTEEIRDDFYENFKELINECKELL